MRLWRVDYYFPELGLAVEKEGGAFCHGRHTRGAGFREDLHKYNALTLQGISLLRFLPEQMRSLEAIATIKQFAENKAQRVGFRRAGLLAAGPAPSLSNQADPGAEPSRAHDAQGSGQEKPH